MIHLHEHSEYSAQDAIAKVDEIAQAHLDMGHREFAITDHGVFSSFPKAFSVAKEKGMKFIPGIEFYVTPPKELDAKIRVAEVGEANKVIRRKTADPEDKAKALAIVEEWDKRNARNNFHLTALARTQEGLNNLFKIYSNGEIYYKYRVSEEDLFEHSAGIICFSGCFGGQVCHFIRNHDIDSARKVLQKYKSVFGENYYVEIMYHALTQDKRDEGQLNEVETYLELIKLARELDIPMVATNDAHYTKKTDHEYHNIYKAISYNKTDAQVGETNAFGGGGFYITNEEELKSRFVNEAGYPEDAVEEMFSNIKVIADSVDEGIDIEKGDALVCKDEELRVLVEDGFNEIRKGTEWEEESRARIEYELDVIKQKNFSHYFINMKKIVAKAYDLGILTGPGRGSGAGSEIVYLLKITRVDPLRYGLMFERFLNPERNGFPDIDLDLSGYSENWENEPEKNKDSYEDAI